MGLDRHIESSYSSFSSYAVEAILNLVKTLETHTKKRKEEKYKDKTIYKQSSEIAFESFFKR